jgi:GNAT superfamily N-acetyltransferase
MPALPDGYTLRNAELGDVEIAVEITNARSVHDIGEGDMTVARMRMFWTEAERNLATDNWFVCDSEGTPVAYFDYTEYDPYTVNEFDYAVLPEHCGIGIEEFIYAVAEERARKAIDKAPPGTQIMLETRVWASNQADQSRLEASGFALGRVWNRMLIEMDALPPEPIWPDGISVRTFQPHEIDTVHAAWEDAQRDEYGFSSLTPEEFRRYLMDEEENFDPTLWFLAIDDATSEIAGYTLCRWERPGEPQTGHIRYVAVRRQYRRRGLGQALLLHTFREFYRRGKRRVGLGVDATSLTGADRLYERAGMRPTHQMLVYEKTLREGDLLNEQ